MSIFVPVASVITILLYFFLSTLIPFLGYLVPYYKISKVNIFGNRYRIIVNLAVLAILYILNVQLLSIYIVFPILTELLFYMTKIFSKRIRVFDRMIIMSLILVVVITSLVYLNRIGIENSLETAIKINSANLKVDIKEVKSVFIFLKHNIVSSVFLYIFLENILLFLTLSPNSYKYWTVSYLWLIPFIIIVFLNQLFKIDIDIFWERNILDLVKIIYIWYGIKTIYVILDELGLKYNFLKHLIGVALGVSYPTTVFVLGALASFEVIKIKMIRI